MMTIDGGKTRGRRDTKAMNASVDKCMIRRWRNELLSTKVSGPVKGIERLCIGMVGLTYPNCVCSQTKTVVQQIVVNSRITSKRKLS